MVNLMHDLGITKRLLDKIEIFSGKSGEDVDVFLRSVAWVFKLIDCTDKGYVIALISFLDGVAWDFAMRLLDSSPTPLTYVNICEQLGTKFRPLKYLASSRKNLDNHTQRGMFREYLDNYNVMEGYSNIDVRRGNQDNPQASNQRNGCRSPGANQNQSVRCFRCRRIGHKARECRIDFALIGRPEISLKDDLYF
jgi:hypothetical protein